MDSYLDQAVELGVQRFHHFQFDAIQHPRFGCLGD